MRGAGGALTGAVGALGDGDGFVGVGSVGEGSAWCTLLELELVAGQDSSAAALVEGHGRGADKGSYDREGEGECGLDHVCSLIILAIDAEADLCIIWLLEA